MNDVSGSSQLVGEREESSSLALCVMEEQYLGHDAFPTMPGDLETLSPHSARESNCSCSDLAPTVEYARPVACTHDDVLGSGGTVGGGHHAGGARSSPSTSNLHSPDSRGTPACANAATALLVGGSVIVENPELFPK